MGISLQTIIAFVRTFILKRCFTAIFKKTKFSYDSLLYVNLFVFFLYSNSMYSIVLKLVQVCGCVCVYLCFFMLLLLLLLLGLILLFTEKRGIRSEAHAFSAGHSRSLDISVRVTNRINIFCFAGENIVCCLRAREQQQSNCRDRRPRCRRDCSWAGSSPGPVSWNHPGRPGI